MEQIEAQIKPTTDLKDEKAVVTLEDKDFLILKTLEDLIRAIKELTNQLRYRR